MARPEKIRVKLAKFERRYAPAVVVDLAALAEVDPGLVDAALPDQHPARFRIVYRLVADGTVIDVLAIGERADHVVYRDTVARLDPTADDTVDQQPDPS